ncbi:adenylate/guanylate cyclase domain-containing protein [Motiliproteus sp. MSK22-1]|uniref:adenylate/guanylate cyclase domain-containing protein n=1 Tax=Motiliproteus sp. MSK22-1 TaxID=1897630 RepID=UPI000977F8D8|nr:adenylate/guanylate cyclase domain-containing protein [Motiliproteus sp. MSK22-1]OMH33696.1 hypothetical protein BGP75_11875 [Motiliproteus sp. MSK22-1]
MEKKLRLATGLVMALFVILHLTNHSLGLISLAWMEAYRKPFVAFWHYPLSTFLLYGSVLTHFGLALSSLYRRNTLKLPTWEMMQLLLGLSIPPLIFSHVVGTRAVAGILDVSVDYEVVIGAIWSSAGLVTKQTLLVIVVWGHLLIGLHYWLRLKPAYVRWLPFWQLLATLLPILALLGFVRVSFEVGKIDLEKRFASLNELYPQQMELIQGIEPTMWLIFVLSVLLVVLARYLRVRYRVKFGSVNIVHPTAGNLKAPVGATLLEALRQAGVPHSSVCGGRARCTTCRVRVIGGQENLQPAEMEENNALAGIKADPNVRLACQLHVDQDISIVPLIPPERSSDYVRKPGGVEGKEQQVAVLFVDLRGSTALGELRLPYDVVFILNQFFSAMVSALAQTNGHYAQFNGDGLMALYGLETDLATGCREAISGAAAMLAELERLNNRLNLELDAPLKVGIGIHSGEAIVGTMGPPLTPIVSAVGDTVNIAARLEAETKVHTVPLVVSRITAERGGVGLAGAGQYQVSVRGRKESLEVLAFTQQQLIEALR